MKSKIILSVILITTAYLGFVKLSGPTGASCVNVYVDFGNLDHQTKITSCVETEHRSNALSILNNARINITGTQKYGNKIVCRVNNLPDASREKCLSMPPENAYWTVLVKKKASVTDPVPKWGWAQTGVSEILLNPGDSLGLVFTENGKVRWPN